MAAAKTSAALAPDGRSFVFVSASGGTPDIWLRQTAGGEPVRLTNDDAAEAHLVYASNGESVFFTRTERGERSIWRIGALGGNARKVVDRAIAPALSPDGRHLVWLTAAAAPSLARGGNYFAIVAGDTNGANSRTLVPRAAFQTATRVAWSPDSRRLAYSSGSLFEPRNLFVIDVATAQVRQVTTFANSGEGTISQEWLPDNRHLVVTYWSAPRTQLVNDLGILDIESGRITRLTINTVDTFESPSVSANGERVIVTASRTERELWKVRFGPDPLENGRNAVRLLDVTADPM